MDIQILDDTNGQCKLCPKCCAHNWIMEMDIQTFLMKTIYILIMNDNKVQRQCKWMSFFCTVQMDIQILDNINGQRKLCQKCDAHNWTVEIGVQISDDLN